MNILSAPTTESMSILPTPSSRVNVTATRGRQGDLERVPCGCDVLAILALHNAIECLELFGYLRNDLPALLKKATQVVRKGEMSSLLAASTFDSIAFVDLSTSRPTNKLLTRPTQLGSARCKSVFLKDTETHPTAIYLVYKLNLDRAARLICRDFPHYAYTVLRSPLKEGQRTRKRRDDTSLFFHLARSNAIAIVETMLSTIEAQECATRRSSYNGECLSVATSLFRGCLC